MSRCELTNLIRLESRKTAEEPQVERGGVVLYRAVRHNELEQIIEMRAYTVPQGHAGKYFYPTREQARAFVQAGWAEAVTSALFPNDVLVEADVFSAAAEGLAFHLPATAFPHGPVTIEPVM